MIDEADDPNAAPLADHRLEPPEPPEPPESPEPPDADAALRRTAPPTSPLLVPLLPTPPELPPNRLGIVAFVLSLVGFVIPIVPSLAGLVCGIVAVRREPRGLAIAAIAVSVCSGCVGSCIYLGLILPFLPLILPTTIVGLTREEIVARSLVSEVEFFRRANGRLPKDLAELPNGGPIAAAQPTPIRIEFGSFTSVDPLAPNGGAPVEVDYRIVSAGDDGTFGTEDDVVVDGLPAGADPQSVTPSP